jgi:hypothetical protein
LLDDEVSETGYFEITTTISKVIYIL